MKFSDTYVKKLDFFMIQTVLSKVKKVNGEQELLSFILRK